MKKYPRVEFLMGLILSLNGVSQFAAAAETASWLTAEMADQVVTEIDNICGDVWCEGEKNYDFEEFVCDTNDNCYLSFLSQDWDVWAKYDFKNAPQHRCEFKNIRSINDLLEANVTERGVEYSLVHSFYESLTACIDRFY